MSRSVRSRGTVDHRLPPGTRGLASAIVVKDGDLFFLSRPDGSVPLHRPHGFGLYFHDCRYLSGYELSFDGRPGEALAAVAGCGPLTTIALSNPDLAVGGTTIAKQTITIEWQRAVGGRRRVLYDRLAFTNFGVAPVTLPLQLAFHADFASIFAIRGIRPAKRGRLRAPRWRGRELVFRYDGADAIRRTLAIRLSETPKTHGTTAGLHLLLHPGRPKTLLVGLRVGETKARRAPIPKPARRPDLARPHARLHSADDRSPRQHPSVRSDAPAFDRVIDRSLRDLRTLASRLDGREFYAAGIPWYVALFGRDSLIASLETLAYDRDIAATTLRLLARRQGRRRDDWRDEEPGKILHELRVGEMARLGEIPQTPYYGTVDATPLFLILLARHAAWTDGIGLFDELRPNVEAALAWMTRNRAANAGYLAYTTRSSKGLANHGWKDSGDAIVNQDGSLARPPIALAEVQGYAYRAGHAIAALYARVGDRARADALARDADDLRARFERDFWLDDLGVFALALQADGKPARVVSSNAGQVLWSGIADPTRARRTATRLMAPDLFSGWGIRTLGAGERRYNPIGYHLGTVWPHDNAIIAAGFRAYGYDAEACRIFGGLVDAAGYFGHSRLPEVFAGFGRDEHVVPVHYPVACHPQAWAAGAVPFLLESALGLVPDASARRLRLVRPVLPDLLGRVEVRGLRVGDAIADLRVERAADGTADVRVLGVRGELRVVVDASPPAGGGEPRASSTPGGSPARAGRL